MNPHTIPAQESNACIPGNHESQQGNKFTQKASAVRGVEEVVPARVAVGQRGGTLAEEVDVVGVQGLEVS